MRDIRAEKCMAKIEDGKAFVCFQLENPEDINEFVKYTKKPLENVSIRLEKQTVKSKAMNCYLWFLCEEIAKRLSEECGCLFTRDYVYRKAISEAGVYVDSVLPEDDAVYLAAEWDKKGIGWFSEEVARFPETGKMQMRFYKGSSAYDGKELKRLLDCVCEMADELGIQRK